MTGVTLAILAGGEGRRMGRPKGELRVGGRPILACLLERLDWAGPTLLVTAPGREHPPGAAGFAREVTDPTSGQGPLRGVITALEAAETDIAVVTTCDMPLIGAEQLARSVHALTERPDVRLLMWARGAQLEPFPLAVRATARASLGDYLERGGRSMQSLVGLEGSLARPAPPDWPDDVWTNLNSPEDFARYLARPGVG